MAKLPITMISVRSAKTKPITNSKAIRAKEAKYMFQSGHSVQIEAQNQHSKCPYYSIYNLHQQRERQGKMAILPKAKPRSTANRLLPFRQAMTTGHYNWTCGHGFCLRTHWGCGKSFACNVGVATLMTYLFVSKDVGFRNSYCLSG